MLIASCSLYAEEAACPKKHISSGLQPIKTNCPPCISRAIDVNHTIRVILELETRINKTIDELNTLCPDDDDPRDAPPPTIYGEEIDENASYCGPDVTSAMMAALARVHQRMKKLPDVEKGIIDAADPFITDSFLMRNMINSDQKPRRPAGEKCPTGKCAVDGNPVGQPCYTLFGKCVPEHVLNEIMFGFIADQVYVPEVVQAIGGQVHQWQNYKGWSMETDTTREAYDFGDELSEDFDWDEPPTPDTVQDDLANLVEDLQEDYPWIKECKACPYPMPFPGWKSDMSRRSWMLHDGKYLNFDGSITKQPIDHKSDEKKAAEKEARRKKRFKEVQQKLSAELEQMKRNKALLARQQRDLSACEQQCKGQSLSEISTGLGNIFELAPNSTSSTKLVGTSSISGESPFEAKPGTEESSGPKSEKPDKPRKPKPPKAPKPPTGAPPSQPETPSAPPVEITPPSAPTTPTPPPRKCRTANAAGPQISLRHGSGRSGLCARLRIQWEDSNCSGTVNVTHQNPGGASTTNTWEIGSQLEWQSNIYSYGTHKISLGSAYNYNREPVSLSGSTHIQYNVGPSEKSPGNCFIR